MTQGLMDQALTSFRRAVIADKNFVEAQFQIGVLCRDKGRVEPMFKRYAFEAFRVAARLDVGDQLTHDQYILSAQEYGRLDELHQEYEALAKKSPDNEIFKRCYKNIVTLEMAMIPQRVDVSGARASSGIRRFAFIAAIGTIMLGLALAFVPVLFRKKNVERSHASGMMRAGMALSVLGFAGVLGATRLK